MLQFCKAHETCFKHKSMSIFDKECKASNVMSNERMSTLNQIKLSQHLIKNIGPKMSTFDKEFKPQNKQTNKPQMSCQRQSPPQL